MTPEIRIWLESYVAMMKANLALGAVGKSFSAESMEGATAVVERILEVQKALNEAKS